MRKLCVVFLLVVVGCRKSEDPAAGEVQGDTIVIQTEQGKATLETKNDSATLHTGEGTYSWGTGQVPEGFPLAVMPGAEVVSSAHSAPSDGDEVFQLGLTVAGDAKAIADFYAKELKEKGLEVTRTDQTGGTSIMVMLLGKSEGVEATAMVINEDGAGESSVTLSWSSRK